MNRPHQPFTLWPTRKGDGLNGQYTAPHFGRDIDRQAEFGHRAVVELLLERTQVDVESRDNNGLTPLAQALKHMAHVLL
jgi:ankyrin repeat protein